MALAACYSSDTQNFVVSSTFSENLWTPAVTNFLYPFLLSLITKPMYMAPMNVTLWRLSMSDTDLVIELFVTRKLLSEAEEIYLCM